MAKPYGLPAALLRLKRHESERSFDFLTNALNAGDPGYSGTALAGLQFDRLQPSDAD